MTSSSCRCLRRSTRFSPPGSKACPATSALSSSGRPSRARSSTSAQSASSLPNCRTPLLERSLATLVRRDLIRPDRSLFAGDEAYRFRHLLIRDAAYRSLSKASRADLHERFAAWLERAGARLGEYEEIVGYHLEQAYRSRSDLGWPTRRRQLWRRPRSGSSRPAAGRSRAATSRRRSACSSARHSLAADDPRRAELLPELGRALIEAGRLSDADRVLGEAMLVAEATADERAESRVLVQKQFLQLLHVTDGGTESGHARGGARDPRLRALRRPPRTLQRPAPRGLAALERGPRRRRRRGLGGGRHARRLAGDEHARAEILTWIASSLAFGPTPVVEGIRRCEEIRGEVSGHLESEALALRHLGGLHAMNGRFDLARPLLATSNAVFEDLGLTLNAATSHNDGMEMLAGDPAAAEGTCARGIEALEQMGEQAFLSTTAAFLAHALYAQGRDDEAERFTELSEELARRDDLVTQVIWRSVRAGILARQGRIEEAEALAREAVKMGESTDFVTTRADAVMELARSFSKPGASRRRSQPRWKGLLSTSRRGTASRPGRPRPILPSCCKCETILSPGADALGDLRSPRAFPAREGGARCLPDSMM